MKLKKLGVKIMKIDKILTPISLAGLAIALSIASNSRYEKDGQLVVPEWRNLGLITSLVSTIGAIATGYELKKEINKSDRLNISATNNLPQKPINLTLNQTERRTSYNTNYNENEEDLLDNINFAQKESNNNLIQHLIDFILKREGSSIYFSAETGSGKSTLLFKIMSQLLTLTKGKADISVIDGKGSYWPLEDYPDKHGLDRVICVDRSTKETMQESLEKVLGKMQAINFLMGQRAKKRQETERFGKEWNPTPYIIVLDEWVALRGYFEQWNKKKSAELDRIFANIIIMGREDGVFVIATGQSHQSNITMIPTGYRANVALVGLSKTGVAQTSSCIDLMINDNWVIPDTSIRECLKNAIAHFRSKNQKFAYCSLSGHYVTSIPYMSKEENQKELEILVTNYYKKNNLVQFPKVEIEDDPWKENICER